MSPTLTPCWAKHTFLTSAKTCITIIATQSSCQPCNWLVNCSESLICIAFSCRCRLGDHGICVNISPCRFIHSLFMRLFHKAWSMRLDLRRNGIKHIVSLFFFGDKSSPTCSAGKLIQHLAYTGRQGDALLVFPEMSIASLEIVLLEDEQKWMKEVIMVR